MNNKFEKYRIILKYIFILGRLFFCRNFLGELGFFGGRLLDVNIVIFSEVCL